MINSCRREVIVTSSVVACEAVKVSSSSFLLHSCVFLLSCIQGHILHICLQVICALILIAREGGLKRSLKEWTLVGSLTASGLPAAIYALQNSLLQISYKNLDSLTFSMLNQTKLFFTALFTYIILGQVVVDMPVGCKWLNLLKQCFLVY